jgi:hypothetical protein
MVSFFASFHFNQHLGLSTSPERHIRSLSISVKKTRLYRSTSLNIRRRPKINKYKKTDLVNGHRVYKSCLIVQFHFTNASTAGFTIHALSISAVQTDPTRRIQQRKRFKIAGTSHASSTHAMLTIMVVGSEA